MAWQAHRIAPAFNVTVNGKTEVWKNWRSAEEIRKQHPEARVEAVDTAVGMCGAMAAAF